MSQNTPAPPRLAVANSKGGVGKTTTAEVLAAAVNESAAARSRAISRAT